MKIILVLALCTLAAGAVPKVAVPALEPAVEPNPIDLNNAEDRNWLLDQAINALIRQGIEVLRRLIDNGSEALGIPPLDPLEIDQYTLNLPLGLINLNLDLKDVIATGVAGFQVHRSQFVLSELSLDLDVEMGYIRIVADHYDLIGDLFTAIPLYGKGKATFLLDGLRFQGKIYLRQSDDGQSLVIRAVENTAFTLPYFKSQLTGVIGGGDIDAIVNAVIEEVVVDYVNRFQGFIAAVVGRALPLILNPFLEQLDTWKYIDLLPGQLEDNLE